MAHPVSEPVASGSSYAGIHELPLVMNLVAFMGPLLVCALLQCLPIPCPGMALLL